MSSQRFAQSGSRGFTLIEVMIAVVVFAILSAMAYSGLRAVIDASTRIRSSIDQVDQLQRAFLLIERDMTQMSPRAIMTEIGDLRPALLSSDFTEYLVEFSRGGRIVLGDQAQSTLIRVAYRIDEETQTLHRLYWNKVDRTNVDEPADIPLLEGVESLSFRYLRESNWQSSWGESRDNTYYTVPTAIEITLNHKVWGEIKRVFIVI